MMEFGQHSPCLFQFRFNSKSDSSFHWLLLDSSQLAIQPESKTRRPTGTTSFCEQGRNYMRLIGPSKYI
jgi:hypothetical protein